MRWIVLMMSCLIAPLLLTGCVAATSDVAQVRIVTVRRPVCPALATYSAVAQAHAADSLERLPRDDPVADMVIDYGRLRATLRAACERHS